ncbi:hypothetical protein [Sporosarcina luteola]|uniref:hypothetical protein n=1 Tax=Sporosarcina luteola TaxID=582850 RepID=UPI00203EFA28|nr:hypothetical protein [Sporosarcina luteola]MCM3712340.1 hypothetical protein [Sporosarcina luteola]
MDAQAAALDAECLGLDARPVALDAECLGLDVRPAALDAERLGLDASVLYDKKRTVTESQFRLSGQFF